MSLSDWVALAALVISVLGAGISVWSTRRQEKQWAFTAMPMIDVTNVEFTPWRYLLPADVRRTTWDPRTTLVRFGATRDSTEVYGTLTEYLAYDTSAGRYIAGVSGITVKDVEAQVAELQPRPEKIETRAHARVTFKFRNAGATAADQFQVDVRMQQADGDWQQLPATGGPSRLQPGQELQSTADGYAPALANMFPNPAKFIVRISYLTVENQKVQRELALTYNPQTAAFQYVPM